MNDRPPRGARPWHFRNRRYGRERIETLWLCAELYDSSCADNADPGGELAYYVRYLEQSHPEWLATDSVPILWIVEGVSEFAPFNECPPGAYAPDSIMYEEQDNFLDFFTWPEDVNTSAALDWFTLPVGFDRFSAFAQQLGWTPSPLQSTCPLRSILMSKARQYPRPPHPDRVLR